MQNSDKPRQDEALRALDEASVAFELGQPQDLRIVVDRADTALRLVEDEASRKAGSAARPLIRMVSDQTKSLLNAARLNPSRADLRVVLLCTLWRSCLGSAR